MLTAALLGTLVLSPSPSAREPESSRPVQAGRGDWMMISGGIFGGGLLVGRSVVSATAISAALCKPQPETGDGCEDSDIAVLFSYVVGDVLAGASAIPLGLLGAGLERRGRWRSDRDAAQGLRRPDRMGREVAGWTLLGAGVGVWVTTSLASWFACKEETCKVIVHETGYYSGALLVGTGIGLAPHEKGYREARSRRAAAFRVSLAPSLGRTSLGLSVSGRF